MLCVNRHHQSNLACSIFMFQDNRQLETKQEKRSKRGSSTFAHFQKWKELPSHVCDEVKALKSNSTSSKYVAFFSTHNKSLDSFICRTMIGFGSTHLQEGMQINQPDDGHANQTAVTKAAWQSSAEHQRVADAQNVGCNGTVPSSSWQHALVPPANNSDDGRTQADADCLPLPQKRARVYNTVCDNIVTTPQDDEDTGDVILGGSPPVSAPLSNWNIPDDFLLFDVCPHVSEATTVLVSANDFLLLGEHNYESHDM